MNGARLEIDRTELLMRARSERDAAEADAAKLRAELAELRTHRDRLVSRNNQLLERVRELDQRLARVIAGNYPE